MSVWKTSPIDHQSRVSTLAMLVVVGLVAGLAIWQGHTRRQTANQLQAVVASVTPLPTETVLGQPKTIGWRGQVSRILMSGQGLEIMSLDAPGGVFQAYLPDGQTASPSEGLVLVRGVWRGYTCAYGGHNDTCVPEVDASSIEAVSVNLE